MTLGEHSFTDTEISQERTSGGQCRGMECDGEGVDGGCERERGFSAERSWTWEIKDAVLPEVAMADVWDPWPEGSVKRAYRADASLEAARHASGWAMRNTNNHNVAILKKSCLGVLVCDRRCADVVGGRGGGATPDHCADVMERQGSRATVYWRPAICDKARNKQIGQPCRTPGCSGSLQLQRCQGRAGYPVTHFWRTDGRGTVFFQGKGTHNHPRPLRLHPDSRRQEAAVKGRDFGAKERGGDQWGAKCDFVCKGGVKKRVFKPRVGRKSSDTPHPPSGKPLRRVKPIVRADEKQSEWKKCEVKPELAGSAWVRGMEWHDGDGGSGFQVRPSLCSLLALKHEPDVWENWSERGVCDYPAKSAVDGSSDHCVEWPHGALISMPTPPTSQLHSFDSCQQVTCSSSEQDDKSYLLYGGLQSDKCWGGYYTPSNSDTSRASSELIKYLDGAFCERQSSISSSSGISSISSSINNINSSRSPHDFYLSSDDSMWQEPVQGYPAASQSGRLGTDTDSISPNWRALTTQTLGSSHCTDSDLSYISSPNYPAQTFSVQSDFTGLLRTNYEQHQDISSLQTMFPSEEVIAIKFERGSPPNSHSNFSDSCHRPAVGWVRASSPHRVNLDTLSPSSEREVTERWVQELKAAPGSAAFTSGLVTRLGADPSPVYSLEEVLLDLGLPLH